MLTPSQYLTIPPERRKAIEARYELNKRLMDQLTAKPEYQNLLPKEQESIRRRVICGMPFILEDAWKYVRQDSILK